MIKALIFDCDGVLVDTERDGHRVGFNRAFKEMGIDAIATILQDWCKEHRVERTPTAPEVAKATA